MGDRTRIPWCDASLNVTRGCTRCTPMSTGGCYAERMAARFAGPGQPYEGTITDGKWNGKIKLVEDHLEDPIRWRKPRVIFIDSMSDLFHDSVPDEYIWRVFEMMAIAHGKNGHTFLLLTKRWRRMMEFSLRAQADQEKARAANRMSAQWPPRGVWWGHSIWDQKSAEESLGYLRRTPAALRWWSAEPLLGPIEMGKEIQTCCCGRGHYAAPEVHSAKCDRENVISWVVVGCQSGPAARPTQVEWVRSLRDQCHGRGVDYGISFYLKQMDVCGRLVKMPELDGRVWDERPKA